MKKISLFESLGNSLKPEYIKKECTCSNIEQVYESNLGTRCLKCLNEVPKNWHDSKPKS